MKSRLFIFRIILIRIERDNIGTYYYCNIIVLCAIASSLFFICVPSPPFLELKYVFCNRLKTQLKQNVFKQIQRVTRIQTFRCRKKKYFKNHTNYIKMNRSFKMYVIYRNLFEIHAC